MCDCSVSLVGFAELLTAFRVALGDAEQDAQIAAHAHDKFSVICTSLHCMFGLVSRAGSRFQIEYAKSNQSTCKVCNTKISQGACALASALRDRQWL